MWTAIGSYLLYKSNMLLFKKMYYIYGAVVGYPVLLRWKKLLTKFFYVVSGVLLSLFLFLLIFKIKFLIIENGILLQFLMNKDTYLSE